MVVLSLFVLVSQPLFYHHNGHSLVDAPKQALLSIIATAIGSKIFYNLYFHPLRSYPGPLLCRATEYYAIFWELQGSSHLKINEWHNKYGEVFRIAPNHLSYNSGRAWEKICGKLRNRPRNLIRIIIKRQDIERVTIGPFSRKIRNSFWSLRRENITLYFPTTHALEQKGLIWN